MNNLLQQHDNIRLTLLALITTTVLIISLLILGVLFADWHWNKSDKLKIQEQTKADLLLMSSKPTIESMLTAGDNDHLQAYAEQLLSLQEPNTATPLLLGIHIESMMEGDIVNTQTNRNSHPFLAEDTLFSNDEERAMLGAVHLYYNDAFYNKMRQREIREIIILAGSLFILMMVLAWVLNIVLQPLRTLSRNLRQIDTQQAYQLPKLHGTRTREVSMLYDALSDLLKEIQNQRENLELRVNERTSDLARALEESKAASRTKSEFLANMSHEIRTPMNAIIGLTKLTLKENNLTPKAYEYLSTVNHSSASLLGIINDILDFSKIEAGHLNIEHVDFNLNDILDTQTDLFRERIYRKKLEFVVASKSAIPSALIGDPLRLNQVLTNLLGNAVKFTEQGEILLQVSCVEQGADQVRLRFSISDTGIGIPADKQEKLFEAFSQADSSITRRFGGTGLGLSISKKLVQLMGGKLTLHSAEGEGSCFSFELPFQCQETATATTLATTEFMRGLHTLVVDDNRTFRELMSDMLDSFTLRTDVACSAEEAMNMLLEQSSQDPYQLIILDWLMPNTDGFQLLKDIRRHVTIADIPVIMMTGFGKEEELQQATQWGANAFLNKPPKQSMLYNVISSVLGEQQPKQSAVPLQQHDIQQQQIQGLRLLLVEDNEINQMVVEGMIGHHVQMRIANHGQEAVDILKQEGNNAFDIILMDMQMPVLDGYEATRSIRQMQGFETIPIIAMTAHAMTGDREKCISAGMNDYISKPIDADIFHRTLIRWQPKERQQTAPQAAQKQERQNLPAYIQDLNVQQALSNMGGNPDLLRSVLDKFCLTQHDSIDVIEQARQHNDAELAIRTSHTLKGLAASIGAEKLRVQAEQLEHGMREDLHTDRVEQQLACARQLLKETIAHIQAACHQDKENTS